MSLTDDLQRGAAGPPRRSRSSGASRGRRSTSSSGRCSPGWRRSRPARARARSSSRRRRRARGRDAVARRRPTAILAECERRGISTERLTFRIGSLGRRPPRLAAAAARPRARRRRARVPLPDARLVVPGAAREDRRADAPRRRLHAAGRGGRRPLPQLDAPGGSSSRSASAPPSPASSPTRRSTASGRARPDELPLPAAAASAPSPPSASASSRPGRAEGARARALVPQPFRRRSGLT